MSRVLVVGAGLFGLTGARELRARGHAVVVLDAGRVPHPDAASTDVSKVARQDYGDDELYTALAIEAVDAWPAYEAELGGTFFHRTGLLVATRAPLDERPFEQATLARLPDLERLDGAAVRTRFEAFGGDGWVDGYLNPRAGWVESGAAITALAERVREEGVELREDSPVAGLVEAGGRVRGVRLAAGAELEADMVLVAAGAWTPRLVPWLADRLSPVAQPVFHLQPADPAPFRAPALPVWAADITTTGWYGFPAMDDGRVKVGHHGPGRAFDGKLPAGPPVEHEHELRAFLGSALPGLADAPLVGGRWCPYCDSFDGDFWLARDPERPGLTVAAGGSGHAFKFQPVLGPLVADACEGTLDRRYERFEWRATGPRQADGMRAAIGPA